MDTKCSDRDEQQTTNEEVVAGVCRASFEVHAQRESCRLKSSRDKNTAAPALRSASSRTETQFDKEALEATEDWLTEHWRAMAKDQETKTEVCSSLRE